MESISGLDSNCKYHLQMTNIKSTKEKGDLLEKIVEKLCLDFEKAKVTRDVKIKGKSGVDRQVDVLIEAAYKSFDIKIIVEAKNYSTKVGIGIVDGLKTKLTDISGNLGVIVCPLGFTDGAIKGAKLHDIQLFQVFDHGLGNTTQFIPLRYVVPYTKSYALLIKHGASGGSIFELPTDTTKWRFYLKDKIFDQEDLITYAWNHDLIPYQKEGEQVIDFGVVKIGPADKSSEFYYLELKASVLVKSDYYVKLFPASFMKNVDSGKGSHRLNIDAYSKKEDMIKNGWKHFDTREAMEAEAKLHDTSKDMHGLIVTESYTLGDL